jgi:group I intron endonuclease
MTCGVYCIFNAKSGKSYIGSAKNIEYRWRKHREMLRRGKHHSLKLQNSWNKHGETPWHWLVVEECPKELLLEREDHYITLLDVFKGGYNMSGKAGKVELSEDGRKRIGEANRNRVCTQATRDKLSAALSGKPAWNKGVKHTDEAKKNMSIAGKGKPKSPEHRAKLAAHCRRLAALRHKLKLLKQPYQWPEERRKKLSEATSLRNATGWQKDPEIRKKNSEGQLGRKLSEETKKKISLANIGRKLPGRTEEQKRNYSKAALYAHAKKWLLDDPNLLKKA